MASRLSAIKRGLFTHEDIFNVHKMLGIPCLFHFMYRTLRVPFRPFDDMGFQPTLFVAISICWHLFLSVSSLIFKLPKVRIKEGSRIWPEFRLHSIVFACRSLACMSLVWYEKRHGLEPLYLVNVLIVFATLIGADVATASVDHHSNTIRGLDTSAAYKFAFSFMQFLGTCGCLVGLRSFGAQFAIVFIIQTYAFTLTLRRKNLVTHRQTVFIYSYQLSIGGAVAQIEIFLHGGFQAQCMFPAIACTAMLLRIGLGLNKYASYAPRTAPSTSTTASSPHSLSTLSLSPISLQHRYLVWLIMSAVIQYARRMTPIVPEAQRIEVPEYMWPSAAVVMLACAYGLFLYRSAQRKAAAEKEAANAEGLKQNGSGVGANGEENDVKVKDL